MANRFIGGVLSSQQPSSGGFVSRASTGTYFNNTGTLVTAPINQPRLNYSFNGNPISTRYSGYFNGSAYLTATMTAFGTNPFTIECWFYLNSIPTAGQTYFMFIDTRSTDTNGSVVYVNNSGVLYYGSGASYATSTGQTLVTNRWYHVAVTRASGTTTCWLNGASVGTTSDSSNLASTQIRIGTNYTAGYNFNTGYISNARIVSGVAVYTGAFTVPTNPLTATQTSGTNISAITGTQTTLLTCQNNAFTDFSASPLSVTNTSVSASTFLPPIYTSDFSGTGWYNPAVLIESSATNLVTYSQDLSNAAWSKAQVTIGSTTTAPDGTNTAYLVIPTAVSGQHFFNTSNITVNPGQAVTISCFVKSGGYNYCAIEYGRYPTAYSSNSFDLINGTVLNNQWDSGALGAGTIIPVGNGWYRISVQVPSALTSNFYLEIWDTTTRSTGSWSGNAVSGIYFWGMQLEIGNTMTSYIPTNGATVTRSQDNVGPTGSGIYTLMALENQTSIDDQATVQSFTATGSSTWTCPVDVTSVEVLVVAGGGGGGHGSTAGGGGGGGVVYNTSYPVTPGTTYPIVVGSGGTGNAIFGTAGSNSQFGNLTAIGGGSGAGAGGSGGGSNNSTIYPGVAGQGYPGGAGYIDGSAYYREGGGGGAGGPGLPASTVSGSASFCGNGGPGLYFNISGTSTAYGGGGGSSGWSRSGAPYPTPGTGGVGGGGNGSAYDTNTPTAGTANTGGGGGAANTGANGGSGIVIIKYKRTQSRLTATSNAAIVTQKFTTTLSSGWTAPAGVTSVEVLVVAGGGGGGYYSGGGGGAGGLVYNSAYTVTPGSNYTVTVGGGGAGALGSGGNGTRGTSGSNSIFGTLTAIGGGGGGSYNATGANGGSGGGGGGGGSVYAGGTSTQSGGYGNAGGAGINGGSENGGGGGGAGNNGFTATSANVNGFAGGAGIPFSITGNLEYYAGGGGGGVVGGSYAGGLGGIGGGGNGISNTASVNTNNIGAPNTGGGGGGGGYTGSSYNGAAGGSGVIIIRYRVPTVATFLDSGSWTCPAGVTSVQALIVGGGGSGSGSRGASNGSPGGGAGGVVYSSSVKVTPGVTYPVIVGQGGIGISGTDGYPGQNSSFAGIVACGGGGGNGASSFDANRFSGGSGGGAGESYTNGQGVYGQGNAGGTNTAAGAGTNAGAGGGGAGGAGTSIALNVHVGGNGGPGLAFTISGTSTYYGGGGGGSCDASSSTYGTGGVGGGGNSTVGTYTTRAGTPNTGGGGGGAFSGVSADNIGGFGGSGIVIIRYYGG